MNKNNSLSFCKDIRLILDGILELGVWSYLNTIGNDDLRAKAQMLPELLNAAFAESTLKNTEAPGQNG